MKSTPRKVLLMLPVAMILLASHQSCFAFGGPPGGPSSNGSYFPNDGTFSAVVRGTNLSGTLQFSTTSGAGPINSTTANGSTSSSGTGGVGSTGVSTIFYSGGNGSNNVAGTYLGNSQGSYNPQSSSLFVSFQGDLPGQGQDKITLTENITIGNGTSSTNQQRITQLTFFDTSYLAGSAACKTSNAFPNQKFRGEGSALLKYIDFPETTGADPKLNIIPIRKIYVNGVRLSNTASAFSTKEVRPPYLNKILLQ